MSTAAAFPARRARHAAATRLRALRTKLRRNRDPERHLPLDGHLRELRTRALKAMVALAVGTVVGWLVYEPVFQALQEPITLAGQGTQRMVAVNFQGIGTAFSIQLKTSLFIGAAASFPVWAYQLGAFVAPGLDRRERRIVAILLISAVPLFAAGIALAWYFLPPSIRILTGFAPDFTATMVNAEVYFDFVLRMLVAFGLAFQLPVVMVGVSAMGLVAARRWLSGWRWAVLIAFAFAAVASPSGDAVTMAGLALPVIVLYFGAVGVCWLLERRQLKRMEKLALT